MSSSARKGGARSCGSCTACCTYLDIKGGTGKTISFLDATDVAKPAGRPCQFCTVKGCGIYENRPVVCREFKCDWLQGRKGYTDADHPHSVGFIGVRGDKVAITG